MPKLFTRTGDDGTTGLLGPGRVSKDDPRVEAMGAVDELNAAIGVAVAVQREKRIRDVLVRVQDDLFTIGAELASAGSRAASKIPRMTGAPVTRLEEALDAFDVGPVREFILPGGSEVLARLHWARTVARRAERRVVAFSRREAVNPEILRYLNRLSSLFYQMALWVQKKERRRVDHPTYGR